MTSLIVSLKNQLDEVSLLKGAFLMLDSDKKGRLSLKEVQNGLNNLCLFEILQDFTLNSEDCSEKILKGIDLDKKGRIDYIKFL